MNINAFAALEAKQALTPFQYEAKELAPYEVKIDITHCGICHSDIHLIDNDWMISKYPLVPGHEIIGTVLQTGTSVTHLKEGMRVGVGWQSGSCSTCEWCMGGQEHLCAKNAATCNGRFGGFADTIVTDSRFAFPIPAGLSSETAAPLLCGGATVYSPFRNYDVKPHHKVGIVGVGGLGHLAIQFAAAMGCEVTAFTSSPDKAEELHKLGATRILNSTKRSELMRAASSIDFLLTTATAALDWNTFIGTLRPNGKLCFVGGTVGNLNFPVGLILGGQKSVCASVIGSRQMITEMLNFSARHNISAITEQFALNDVNTALQKVRENKVRYRAVLTMK